MAEPAPPQAGGSFSQRMTHKVGPLPVWAWAIIVLVVGYYLYKHFQGSSTAATGTTPASASTPIPAGDQSGGGVGSASGSSGTTTPTSVTGQGTPGDRVTNDLAGQTDESIPTDSRIPIHHVSWIPATSGATSARSFSSAGHGL